MGLFMESRGNYGQGKRFEPEQVILERQTIKECVEEDDVCFLSTSTKTTDTVVQW